MSGSIEAAVVERLAAFVQNFRVCDAPPDVVGLARSCLLYGLGVAACGLATLPARVGADAITSIESNPGPATVLNSGLKTSIAGALVANTALFHARAQEDTCGTAHLGAVLIPLLLAIAEAKSLGLENLLPALIVGYEVGGQLEAELAADTLASGFRATPLYGLIAASAAASRLLGLDKPTTANALSFAVAFDGSNVQTIADGSDEWRFQLGVSAQSALTAVQLAIAGASGSKRAFEGKFGFARVFAKREFPMRLFDELGANWILRRVMFKPYPICQHNQSAAAGAIRIRDRLRNSNADRIEVHISPYMVPGMLLKGPFARASETLLSTSFCVACAISRGRVEIDDLEAFDDPDINRLNALVTLVPTERLRYPASEIVAFEGDKEIARHAEIVTEIDFNYSFAQSKAQLERMFEDRGLPPEALETLERFVERLPSGNLSEVITAFEVARR
jgi:2-methylcitrate dehydratase PrpD